MQSCNAQLRIAYANMRFGLARAALYDFEIINFQGFSMRALTSRMIASLTLAAAFYNAKLLPKPINAQAVVTWQPSAH